jgi:putative flippase GtrA
MENRLLEFLLFTLIGFVGLGLNELFLWILTDLLLIYYLLSKIITAIIVYLWNFFARKIILSTHQCESSIQYAGSMDTSALAQNLMGAMA